MRILKKKKKLIQQGAEAKIYLIKCSQKRFILKSRIKKSYRHPELDKKIRTRRTRAEAKVLTKALKAEAKVPKVLNIDYKSRPKDKFNLEIEYIEGEKLSETLNSKQEKEQFKIMQQIGEQIAILHSQNIIHGDLTTSNIILKNPENQIFIIDFGLGFMSKKIEDKAVDLHLIKQALEAKHFQNHKELFKEFLKEYKHEDYKKVLEQLKKVESRGRYKH